MGDLHNVLTGLIGLKGASYKEAVVVEEDILSPDEELFPSQDDNKEQEIYDIGEAVVGIWNEDVND